VADHRHWPLPIPAGYRYCDVSWNEKAVASLRKAEQCRRRWRPVCGAGPQGGRESEGVHQSGVLFAVVREPGRQAHQAERPARAGLFALPSRIDADQAESEDGKGGVMETPAIVVAVDGTDPSMTAVRWAALEAQRSNRNLLIIHILDWDWAVARYDFGGQQFDLARQLAEGLTGRAAHDARATAPAIEVSTKVLVGNAVARLVIASEQTDLLILGNRGHGGFTGLGLGSVSQRVATHAHCPVVVVRGRAATDGPVAVGVDDSETTDAVLETAFTEARKRGTTLVAIRSYLPVLPLVYDRFPPADITAPDQDETERTRLGEQLGPWRAKYPDVPVEALLSHDSAAAVLNGVSRTAQLVVVGSRGHGVIAGTLLGSTGLQLLHHADCPVLIVRPKDRRDDR
jgi:nucleotide-binding universal stress UspA family protein